MDENHVPWLQRWTASERLSGRERLLAASALGIIAALAAGCSGGPTEPDGPSLFEVRAVMNCMPYLDAGSLQAEGAALVLGGDTFDLVTFDTLATGEAFSMIPPDRPALLLLRHADGTVDPVPMALPEVTGDTVGLAVHVGYRVLEDRFLAEAAAGWFDQPDPPASILFVGNSYTYANGGLDSHVDSMLSERFPDLHLKTGSYTVGGATLENHFHDQDLRALIQSGGWDLVVFQEQSLRPIENPDLMWEFAFLLDSVVTESGGRTSFFMTWPREYAPQTLGALEYAYRYAGAHLDASVAPVGTAWLLAVGMAPSLDLWESDMSHPTISGTYLAACVYYSLLTGESAQGMAYAPGGVGRAAEVIRQAAWAAVSARAPVDWRWF